MSVEAPEKITREVQYPEGYQDLPASPCILPADWTLWQRINWVRAHEYYIQKDATVEGYRAVTHDAVTAALHNKLVQAGIIIFPSLVESSVQDIGKTQKGTTIIRYSGTYDVTFMGENGDTYTMRVEAHANDHGDKAPGKACSYAQKTAMLKMFMLETGVNDEGRIDAKIAQEEGQKPIPEEHVKEINRLLKDHELDREKFMGWLNKVMKVNSVEEIPNQAYDDVMRTIQTTIKNKEKVRDNS